MNQQKQFQTVDLYGPIVAQKQGRPPLVMIIGTRPSQVYTVEGTMSGNVQTIKPEAYVLMSALPDELRHRVETAIAALTQAM